MRTSDTPDINRSLYRYNEKMLANLASMDWLQSECLDIPTLELKDSQENNDVIANKKIADAKQKYEEEYKAYLDNCHLLKKARQKQVESMPAISKEKYETFYNLFDEISQSITEKMDITTANAMSHFSLNLLAWAYHTQHALLQDVNKAGIDALIQSATDLKKTTQAVFSATSFDAKIRHINILIKKTDASWLSPEAKKQLIETAWLLTIITFTAAFYISLGPVSLIAKGILTGVHLSYSQAAAIFYPTNSFLPLLLFALKPSWVDTPTFNFSLNEKQKNQLSYLQSLSLWATKTTPPAPKPSLCSRLRACLNVG